MPVEDLLLETLEDLDSDDFDTFKWRLTHRILEDCTPIPKARLDNAKRTDTVSTLMEYYMEKAVNVTIEVLKKMKNNLAAEKLRSKYAGEILSCRNPNGDTLSFFLCNHPLIYREESRVLLRLGLFLCWSPFSIHISPRTKCDHLPNCSKQHHRSN